MGLPAARAAPLLAAAAEGLLFLVRQAAAAPAALAVTALSASILGKD